ncbi:MAG TPA: amino acid ABC transporter permease [Stellaceae bacterium]|nr:amino acid ABC transporter permease [Stellaceae bacterium]
MNYQWDWGVLLREPYAGWLISGIGWTLLVSAGSWVVALAAGLLIGVARGLPNRLIRLAARCYVELFRNVPPLAQLFLWYFVFPEIVPKAVGLWIKRDMPEPELVTAVVAIGLFGGARVAEQVRAGIDAVGRHLLPAALATGLRPVQAYRLVLLPVGLRAIVGPLTSEFLVIFKMSSISLTIGVMDLTAESRHIENYTFHGFEAFAVATAVYLVLGLLISAAMSALDRRLRPAAIPT